MRLPFYLRSTLQTFPRHGTPGGKTTPPSLTMTTMTLGRALCGAKVIMTAILTRFCHLHLISHFHHRRMIRYHPPHHSPRYPHSHFHPILLYHQRNEPHTQVFRFRYLPSVPRSPAEGVFLFLLSKRRGLMSCFSHKSLSLTSSDHALYHAFIAGCCTHTLFVLQLLLCYSTVFKNGSHPLP